jgi:tetratricopeptide (TPR) repeat protein/TolB-like protein
MLVGVSIVVLAAVGVGALMLRPTAPPERVAVLAFEERTEGGPSEPWRLDGLGTALTQDLAVPNERVVLPWATSQRHDLRSSDPVDLALELVVDRLVHGQLVRRPDSLVCRVTVVDGGDGTILGTVEERAGAQEQIVLHQLLAQKIDRLLRGKDPSAVDESTAPSISASRAQAHGLTMRGAGRLIEGTDDSTRRAQVLFEEAIAADSTFADAWVGLGAVYTDRLYQARAGGSESFDLADRAFRRALEIDPHNTRALEGIVNVLFLRGQFVECARVVQDNRWARGDEIEILLLQGRALIGSMPELAIAKYMRVLELDRNNREALWWLVPALNFAGDHDGCVEMSTRYLRQFRNDTEVRTWRGLSMMALGRMQRAVNEVRVAVDSRAGNNLYTSIYAGMVNRRAGNETEAGRLWSEAAARGEQLLAAAPSNHRIREHLAILYGWLGDVQSMERVLDTDPGVRHCESWCITFELWFLIDLGREDELLRILTEGVDQWGNFPLIDSFLHDMGYDDFLASDGYRRYAEVADREAKRLRRSVTF